jgi:hypothetical protein
VPPLTPYAERRRLSRILCSLQNRCSADRRCLWA